MTDASMAQKILWYCDQRALTLVFVIQKRNDAV